MSERLAAWLSVGIFGVVVFVVSAALGFALFYAALASVCAVGVIGGFYLYRTQGQELFESNWSVVVVAIIVLFSFGTDCAIGFVNVPRAPFIDACVSHSGIGFPLTVGLAVILVGALFIAKIHSALLRRFGVGS